MQGCREAILQEIEVLSRSGNPGSLRILPGQNVETIVTSDEGHIVAAATTFGEGRIFVTSHSQYFMSFKEGEKKNDSVRQLHENVFKWVSDGKCKGLAGIQRVKDLKGEVTGQVLVYHGGKIEDGIDEKVKMFVEKGGGLVHSICASAWQTRNKDQNLTDLPLAGLLQSAGIVHTMDVVRCNRNGFPVMCSTEARSESCGEVSIRLNPSEDIEDPDEDPNEEVCEQDEEDQEGLEPAGGNPQEWKDYDDLVKDTRAKILHEVDRVLKYSAPGCCVPYGKHSVSILSGSDPQNVFIASGVLGNGRVLIITHSDYYKKRDQGPIRKLMQNVFNWVSNGEYKDPDDILELTEKNNFKDKKIAVWTGADLNAHQSKKVMEFVKEGGGLIHTAAAWGWLKLYQNKRLKDLPLTDLLIEAGLFFTRELCSSSGRFQVDLSDTACHKEAVQNIGYVLARAGKIEDLERYGEYLSLGLGPAPAVVKAKLENDIKAVFDCHKAMARFPLRQKPLTDPAQQCLTLLCDELCNLGSEMRCVPCIDDFPGPCPQAPTVCAEREVTTQNKDFHSTGLYVQPGTEIEVEILSHKSTLQDGWVFRIGAHTDKNFKKDTWRRWPILSKRRDIDEVQFTMFSPYGGLIYLESLSFKKDHSISLRISNVLEAPQYTLMDPDAKNKWLACRDNPGPWADLRGRYISFTMPSSSVRHLEDPGPAIALWDRVVATHCELRGTEPADHRHQWVVSDAQPSIGYMHAGYPIVTMMDVADPDTPDKFLLNHENMLANGRWGMFHELGHNMQRRWWSFKGTGEVTCNIFTMHAMDVISNKEPWIIDWLEKHIPQMEKTLKKDDPYEDWVRNPGIALGVYAQLQHCFGWGAYTKVFRHYEDMDWTELPNRTAAQINCWIETFSKTVGYNLCPMFEYWGFQLPDALKDKLTMTPFLPDDRLTRLAPDRVKVLEERYSDLVRQLTCQP